MVVAIDSDKHIWSGSLASITAKRMYSHVMSLISCINIMLMHRTSLNVIILHI